MIHVTDFVMNAERSSDATRRIGSFEVLNLHYCYSAHAHTEKVTIVEVIRVDTIITSECKEIHVLVMAAK